jgi:hypothetical protein
MEDEALDNPYHLMAGDVFNFTLSMDMVFPSGRKETTSARVVWSCTDAATFTHKRATAKFLHDRVDQLTGDVLVFMMIYKAMYE